MDSTVIVSFAGQLEQLLKLDIEVVLSITEDLGILVTDQTLGTVNITITFECNVYCEGHSPRQLQHDQVGLLPFLLEAALEADAAAVEEPEAAHDGVGDALEAGGHGGDVEPVRHPRVGARLPPQPPAGQRGAGGGGVRGRGRGVEL